METIIKCPHCGEEKIYKINLIKLILLSLITLGIYAIYKFQKTMRCPKCDFIMQPINNNNIKSKENANE